MSRASAEPTTLLRRALEGDRVHSGYLLSGDADETSATALTFARALVCTAEDAAARPCDACRDCARSHGSAAAEAEAPIEIDGTGKRGPLFRHVGDHPDLFWLDRGDGTRVRIGQVRALQNALRLGSHEGGRRVAVIAGAEWLNTEAQNALLRLLEEPPDATTLVLATASPAGLLATIRSRCQRVRLPVQRTPPLRGDDAPDEVRLLAERLDHVSASGLPDLLDWAEEYRGERARAAEGVSLLIATGAEWLRERTTRAARDGHRDLRPELDAFGALQRCRRDLAQRNANPQMVAERALFALARRPRGWRDEPGALLRSRPRSITSTASRTSGTAYTTMLCRHVGALPPALRRGDLLPDRDRTNTARRSLETAERREASRRSRSPIEYLRPSSARHLGSPSGSRL